MPWAIQRPAISGSRLPPESPTTHAVFHDGISSRKQSAMLAVGEELRIETASCVQAWPWASVVVEHTHDQHQVLRQQNQALDARLVVTDSAVFEQILARLPSSATAKDRNRRESRRLLGWASVAIISIGLTLWLLIPVLASRLAVLVPWSWETRMASGITQKIDTMLGASKPDGCGMADGAGRAALAKLSQRLEAHAGLPIPLSIRVLEVNRINAFAFPGGNIRVLDGLLQKTGDADELAAVISHEIGHVVHRDALRNIIHVGGISFVLGNLLGDFAGGAAIILVAKTLLEGRFSQETETRADLFGADLVKKAGGDPSAARRFFMRVFLPMDKNILPQAFSTHPLTLERVKRLPESDGSIHAGFLTPDEWTALRAICAEKP